jgi:hypothetical protein
LWFRASSNIQIKTPNQMQQSIVKFIALSHRCCSTCFRYYYAHHQEPFQTAFAASGFRINAEVDVFPADNGWKHIHLGFYTETGGCDCSSKVMLFVLFCVLLVCKCVLPPGDNPIAINEYINMTGKMLPQNMLSSVYTTKQ